MIKVGNAIITASVYDIVQILKQELNLRGIMLLNKIVPGTNNIQVTCPIHSNGQERKPSCGISTVARKSVDAGTVHCFTCGYRASLPEFISACFGRNDRGEFGKNWLIKKFVSVQVTQRPDLSLDFDRKRAQVEQFNYISEEELDSYRYTHPYLYQRGMTDEIIEEFDLGYDANFKLPGTTNILETVTFPVRDINGNTLFIARRAINQKLFYYPESVDKPIYGIYELDKTANEVIVCESMFNALSCRVFGRQSIALLGLGTESQYKQLEQLPCRKLIIGLDPDNAGRSAGQRLKKRLQHKKIISFLDIPEGKDLNDLTEEEFNNLSEYY